MSKKKSGRRVWRGVTTATASLLALSVCASTVVDGFRTDIDKFLGTKSTKLVTENSDGTDLYTFKSDYTSTTDLLHGIQDVGERMSEEGSVLLKNNGALPLTQDETQKITLLGFSSYYPVQGGDMGSSLVENTGTDADTVDMVGAFKAKGFGLNQTVADMYEALQPTFKSEVQSWGGTIEYNHITAPSTTGVFSSKEPSQAALDGQNAAWKDSMNDNNVMIVTIARSASENGSYNPGTAGVDPTQNLNQTDPLGLSDDERDLINAAVTAKASNGGKVIVLLNNASAMEVQEIQDNDGVDAILQVGLPGGYGFYGVADILSGDVSPSGHLTDTYAVKNANSPAAQNFGDLQWTNANPDIKMNDAIVEAENIYIGYKYYETRYFDTVMNQGNASSTVGSSTGSAWNYDDEVTYPFGYGLSYTTFTQTLDDLNVDLENETVTAKVTVTNTGSVAGKDVVQLYVSLPYTDYDKEHGVEKAAVQLLDYGKTAELAPGASETVTITADMQNMASWDSTADNAAGTKGCYILDAGDYYFTIGNGAHEAVQNVLAAEGQDVGGDADKAKSWNLGSQDTTTFATTKNGTAVENQLADMDVNYWLPGTATYLSRADWEGTFPKTYKDLTATDEMIDILDNDIYEINANGDPSTVTFGADNGLTLADLKGVSDINDERWDMLMDEITLEECMIRTGFGGTSTKVIESIMSPETIQNDGPNGIYSYPLGQYANTDASTGDPCVVDANDPNLTYKMGTMVNETVIAQTFNKDLAADYGRVIGNYSLWANTTIFWGIGTNLHRLPYNARNHEYYSEDAVLTAGQGTAYAAAAMEYGVIIAPKHLAFNDTEINRTGVSVFMTEQQARENELRGTQGIVENAHVLGVMTAYNRVGITQDNAHTGLTKNILRNEWGFQGLISEDFIQDANYVVLKEAVLNGVTMSCNTGDNTMAAVSEKYPYWTVEAVSQDTTMMTALKQAMKYQNYALANSNAMDGMASNTKLVSVRTWYDNALTAVQIVFAALTVLAAAMYVLDERKSKKQ
ncbi:glycoside hydrolase family 3 C-terminal domain-containing protein [Gemmiger formicilis]|uniref:glycoside hydrolase family 3 C-terminal domain-containing protein n=1 Tax=Gemmiger formicilis TaxID=745368 RepID=UPI003CEF78F8